MMRPATAADYPAYARLFPQLETGDPVPPPDKFAELVAPNAVFLDGDGGAIAYGFAEATPPVGYVRNVVVDAAARRRGAGRAVMAALAERLRGAGCTRWQLNVKVDNGPAIALYRALGMREDYRSVAMSIAWADVGKLAPAPPGIAARPPSPSEDAALEEAYRMQPGQLARDRAAGDLVLLRLCDEAQPRDLRLGFARFTPWFPGAYPFRAAAPPLARALLDALRPHALPRFDYTRLVVEDDPALAAALAAAGAEVKMTLAHFEGPLPGE